MCSELEYKHINVTHNVHTETEQEVEQESFNCNEAVYSNVAPGDGRGEWWETQSGAGVSVNYSYQVPR